MIRKTTILFAALLAAILLTACGGKVPETVLAPETAQPETMAGTAPETETAPESAPAAPAQGKTLVVYFSATGHTAPIAKTAAALLNADLAEIIPAQAYTEADLNYGNSQSRTSLEQNDSTARPEFLPMVLDMDAYDTVIIGHPIWWGQAPKIVYTFLESWDFSGKTLTTFCTSASSGLGSSAENLKSSISADTRWLESRRFPIGTEEAEIAAWLREIGLLP